MLQTEFDRSFTIEEVQQAAASNPAQLQKMLTADQNRVFESDSVLHMAANAGCAETIELLLNAKIDPDLLNAVRDTLHLTLTC